MIRIALPVLLLAAALPAGAQYRQPAFRPDTGLRGAVSSDPAVALGIGDLRATPLPEGTREIRIWTGIAIAIPHDLLRLVRRGDTVHGMIARHWPVSAASGPGRSPASGSQIRILLGDRCEGIWQAGRTQACVLRLTARPDWRAIWDSLDTLGVWTLPDQSELPRDRLWVLDGWGMTVEVRDGPRYRSYSYANPDAHSHPAQAAAAAIARASAPAEKLIVPAVRDP